MPLIIVTKYDHSIGLKNDGTVVAWGDNAYGQSTVPVGLTGIVDVKAGGDHSLALKNDGTVVAWGRNNYGQSTVPVGLIDVTKIWACNDHNLALKSDGTVVAWGRNDTGQSTVPVGLTGVTEIGGSSGHSLVLKNDGTVVAWGDNSNGQCNVPVGLTGVIKISVRSRHNLVLKNDGTVVAWGWNVYGQCNVPVGLTGVTNIVASYTNCLVLKNDGTVVAWGDNGYGQSTVPVGLTGVIKIHILAYHCLALKNDGTVVAWGYNVHGESNVPVGLTGVVDIVTGNDCSYALKSNDNIVTWGNNDVGQCDAHYHLTYIAGLNGTISGASAQIATIFDKLYGTEVIAVPDPGYAFSSWSDGYPTAARTDINVTGNKTVTANFILLPTYTLTYIAGAGGTITGNTSQTVTQGNNGTQVIAVPDPGYAFSSWSDGYPTAARTDINVTDDKTVTANFILLPTYTLTYIAGAGGTLTGSTSQTVIQGNNGSQVTAVPNTGYYFLNWSDGLTTPSRTDLNVQSDKVLTANFVSYSNLGNLMINITLTSGNILRLDDGINPQINIPLTHTPGDWYHIAVVRSGLFLRVYENATLLGQFNLNSIVNYQTNFVQDGPKSIFDTIVLPRAVTQEEIEYYYDNVLKGGDEVLPDL